MHNFILYIVVLINMVAGLPVSERNPIDELYENLLQREDIGQIGFPKHEVERKAQRSPSLRLRFGRSDPTFLNFNEHSLAKRYYNWFGDVNQKPIRSPSLRLRFGRRSDPSVPLHSDMDRSSSPNEIFPLSDSTSQSVRMLLEALKQIEEENNNQYFDKENNNENENTILYDTPNSIDEQNQQHSENQQQQFDRETRKQRNSQLRLRWGRSTGNIPPSVNNMDNNQEKLIASTNNESSTGNKINKNLSPSLSTFSTNTAISTATNGNENKN
ncbi:short neuropeptide F [Condylostylus longicornis]|uniref:short neuropeptide F n=1 Tax=Condylostylus longicornis TaxID=2530218 RepID=UPI00244DF2DF|nr:short neuropeptide F [Condylostylus longicornis]